MSKGKAVLGRGLSALISNQSAEDEDRAEGRPASRVYSLDERSRLAGRVAEIEVESISPNPYQPRRDFDEAALEELAESIRHLGIIQPVTVRSLGQGRFEIISGERRLRAARKAALVRIPAYVREADSEAMLEMAIVENVQREELNPMEIALGYQRLIDECSLTQEQVAAKVGKNRATVANFLRLLRLPTRVQAALRDGTITTGHARALINVEQEEAQVEMLRAVQDRQLSVREVEELVRLWHQRKDGAGSGTPEEEGQDAPAMERDRLQIRQFTDRLRSHFSTQVQIRHKSDDAGGRIEIAYYSAEDLERLMELLHV